ncbi:MAG: homoserine dehydrogenase [Lachnospiraceae bacterium]|nr:homoserine dehydrogenase [Lachnospiraceae bacterium]
MIKIAVLGYGTVGSGVVHVLETNKDLIAKRVGQEIEVSKVLDLRDFEGDPIQAKITHNYDDILNDDEIKIVVEVMGGVEPAYTFVKQALLKGKHVATSNKALVADKGSELLKIAKDNNINFLFEASVGGGIPIIRPIFSSLTAEDITDIKGILNGTTNYMLTKMGEEGAEYDDVLKDAQNKGYAEADPTADVEGYDACRKIAILTALANEQFVDFNDIKTEGITKISKTDMKYADALNATIKLIGASHKENDKVYAYVAPILFEKSHPLAGVSDVFNAIFVKGNMLGDAMFYGQGAGKDATASAVVADIIDEARNLDANIGYSWSEDKLELADIDTLPMKYFVRVKGDKEADVKSSFGDVRFVKADGVADETAFVTDLIKASELNDKLNSFELITAIKAEI